MSNSTDQMEQSQTAEPTEPASSVALSPRRRRWPKMLLAALAAWILLEAIAFVIFAIGGARGADPVTLLYKAHPYRVYELIPGARSSNGAVSINSLGFRGPEFDKVKTTGTVRIACLGGSTTFSDAATTDAHTYPARLERMLRDHYAGQSAAFGRIEVINAGVPGYTSLESLIHFESRVLDYTPDIAIFHHGLNDAIFMARFKNFVSDYTHARKVFYAPKPHVWEHSAVLSLVFPRFRSATNPYRSSTLAQLTLVDPARLNVPEAEQRRCFDPKRLDIFARNVRNFIYVARGHGVTPVLSTVVIAPSEGFFAEVVGQVNDRLRQTAAQLSVPCIDVAREMPWSQGLFVDTCHPNEKGLEREGRIFADQIIREGLIEKAGSRIGTNRTN